MFLIELGFPPLSHPCFDQGDPGASFTVNISGVGSPKCSFPTEEYSQISILLLIPSLFYVSICFVHGGQGQGVVGIVCFTCFCKLF